MSENPEVRRWAIHLSFNVAPRYAGEFTKELLQVPWLWGNRPAPVEAAVTEAVAPVVPGVAVNEVAEPVGPASPRSVTGSVKDDEDDEAMSHHS